MANEPTTTITGNLTADPELRFTPAGAPVVNFTVASTPRVKDANTNEWKDGEAMFVQCVRWRNGAENVADSLHKGTRVVVHGKFKARSYETRDGDKRTVWELEVEDIGPSLLHATAQITKNAPRSGGQQAAPTRQQPPQAPQPQQAPPAAANDPWATAAAQPAPPASQAPQAPDNDPWAHTN